MKLVSEFIVVKVLLLMLLLLIIRLSCFFSVVIRLIMVIEFSLGRVLSRVVLWVKVWVWLLRFSILLRSFSMLLSI